MPTLIQQPEQKHVKITSKRQFTIPQKYYKELGFSKDALCILGDGFLIIRPATQVSSGEFSEQILAELISEGYTGQTLLDEFKKRQAKVRTGVEAMLAEAKAVAQGAAKYSTYDDIFGPEDS
jgi:bifunctional DNA-binding transcriptional regulator/antitoxin component of YhaV-PrlF toxin-antitoxin module